MHISHPVTNFEFFYEPFYVAPDVVPPHDERFIGYGYTRNSQVCCVDRIIFNILWTEIKNCLNTNKIVFTSKCCYTRMEHRKTEDFIIKN